MATGRFKSGVEDSLKLRDRSHFWDGFYVGSVVTAVLYSVVVMIYSFWL